MRKYISVIILAARSTAGWILAIITASAAVEFALLVRIMKRYEGAVPESPEGMVTQSRIGLVAAVAFVLLCGILCLYGSDLRGGKPGLTVRRLSISEGKTVALWSLYNTSCFIILWGVQLVICLGFCKYYAAYVAPEYINEQTFMLSFYHQKFLHSLLPLEETSRLIRNITLALGLGVTSALFHYRQRRGQKSIAVIFLTSDTVFLFARPMGEFGMDLFISALTVAITCAAVYTAREARNAED